MKPKLIDCPKCNGTGEVTEWDFGYLGLILVDCEPCNGTGKVLDDSDFSHSTSLLEDYPDTPTPEKY